MKMTWRNQALNLARQRHPILLQNRFVVSKNPHSSLSRCRCPLLVPVNVLRCLDTSSSHSKPLGHLHNRHGRLPRLRFCRGALLPNFNRMVDGELLIILVQRLEDIFSIALTNSHAWFSTWASKFLLSACLLGARAKMTVSAVPKRLNYYVIFVV